LRLGFVQDTTDRLQAILTLTSLVVLLTVISVIYILKLNLFYSITGVVILTFLTYYFIGRLLKKTKKNLSSGKLFISNISHELNDSMSFIQLNSEIALQATDSNYQKGLSKIKSQELIDALKNDLNALKDMTNIIHNLSIIASYEYRPNQIELKQINLRSLLESLCKTIANTVADKKKIYIHIDHDSSPIYISGNKTSLEQMIKNLLSNAVKYSPIGSKITASVSTDKNKVTMSIKDTGIGMSEKDMQKMFDPFYRSPDSLVREEDGSGLGLAIVYEVIKEHKAQIFVKSILKKGTEIIINFPLLAQNSPILIPINNEKQH
jgi:signal transduction histidine kinase